MSKSYTSQTFLDRLTADWDVVLKAPKVGEFPGGRKKLVCLGRTMARVCRCRPPSLIGVT